MNHREEWHLPTQSLGRRVLIYECLESTNTLAATLADDRANDGVVILAEEQRAGRGQQGRSWHCPPGAGVLLSVLLFPPPALRRPALLTAWAAVSVCEAIRLCTGVQSRIKWPNDVLIRGHKVCGILIEQGRGTVVGIGLNVNQSAASLAAAGLPGATSLAACTGRTFEVAEMARLLIGQLDEEYQRLSEGDLATLEACWKWRLGLLGKAVLAECPDGIHSGRLRELAWDGLELQVAGGKIMRLLPESVRHLVRG